MHADRDFMGICKYVLHGEKSFNRDCNQYVHLEMVHSTLIVEENLPNDILNFKRLAGTHFTQL